MSFALLCLMSIATLSAQGVEEVTLVVSGDGATKEEATHVALRSAIEQAFGCFVSANTEILNDSLVKDEIVTVTSGSISSYDELNVTELDSALISVTLRATVSVNKLISYAKSKGSSCELSGALLTQEKRMLEMNIANTKKALNHLFTLVNEYTAKNDLFDYTFSIENIQINGFVRAIVTCERNKNGDNLIKMICDYLDAISIDREQVEHLQSLGFSVKWISVDTTFLENRTYRYPTYADLSSVNPKLKQSIENNINRRSCVLFVDNLGFVYPEVPQIWSRPFFDDKTIRYARPDIVLGIEDQYGKAYTKPQGSNNGSARVYLQIPDSNMASLSRIELVPYSDPRFDSFFESIREQIQPYLGKTMFLPELDYYIVDKLGLYFCMVNRLAYDLPEEELDEIIKFAQYCEYKFVSLQYRKHPYGEIESRLHKREDSVNSLIYEIERFFQRIWGKNYYENLPQKGLDTKDGQIYKYQSFQHLMPAHWISRWDGNFFENRDTSEE